MPGGDYLRVNPVQQTDGSIQDISLIGNTLTNFSNL